MEGNLNPNQYSDGIKKSVEESIKRSKDDVNKVREWLDKNNQVVYAKYEKEREEIHNKWQKKIDEGQKRFWDKVDYTEKVSDDEFYEGHKRRHDAFKYIKDFNDRTSKISDRGFKDFLRGQDRNSMVSRTRVEEELDAGILDSERYGGENAAAESEARVTAKVMEMLGFDDIKFPQNEKEKIARMVWGREIVAKRLVEKSKEEETPLTMGDVRTRMNVDIMFFAEFFKMDTVAFSKKVNSIAFACGSEDGLVKIVESVNNKEVINS